MAMTTVQIGESGANVAAVQRWLQANYPGASGLTVTGVYDEPTAALIRQWKAEHPGAGGDPTLNQFVIPSEAIAGYIVPEKADTPAKAQLKSLLDQWGLGDLSEWAWGQLTSGQSEDQVLLSLRDQDAYKRRFAGNLTRKSKGLQPLSEAEYLAWEKQAASMMRAAGLPAGFYDAPDDFANMIANDVSLSELSGRVAYAKELATKDPSVLPEEAAAMRDLYGLGTGDLAAYLLDPSRAMPIIDRQINAAKTAAAARVAGYGNLTAAEAERIGGLTSSVEQAAQGFTQLARMRELFDPLPGEAGAAQIDRATQIEATFGGNAQAQDKLSRRQRARQAAFQAQQGDYSTGGLGRSTTAAL